jgi:2-hydroxy-3-oxopropionate reductase
MRIGFIGLGVMGRPIVDNLIAGGHELSVCRGRTDVDAYVCRSGKEAAERSEVVILMVPTRRMWSRPCSLRVGWRKDCSRGRW